MECVLDKKIVIIDAAKAVPGRDLPGCSLSNAKLTELMGEVQHKLQESDQPREIEISDESFPYERVGISSRCILDEFFGTYDLALAAGKKVLHDRRDLHKIKMIVVATISPDRTTPNIASGLQHSLGLPNSVQALDIRVGCSGFMASLETSARMLQSYPEGSMALVIGVDTMSRLMDAGDRNTCIIFGDGGGAVLLGSATDKEKGALKGCTYRDPWCITSVESYTDGSKAEYIEVKNDPVSTMICRFSSHGGEPFVYEDYINKSIIHMEGRNVYKDMLRLVPQRINYHLRSLMLNSEDIDLFLFHQANLRMVEAITKIMHIPEGKMYNNIENMGNTTDGCVPCLIADKLRANNLNERRAIMVAFGTGYVLTSAYMERASIALR